MTDAERTTHPEQSRTSSVTQPEPIAILSLACRLPGGIDGPESYWRVLEQGLDVIEPFPAERWDAQALYSADPDEAGKTYGTQGGFVREADRFDAAFFGIAPREAEGMDPAQRIALECVWEAIERARMTPAELRQSQTGVYLGTVYSDYEPWGGWRGMAGMDGYGFTGRDGSVLSGRVSYTLDLQGPAVTVNTACSSSLVAVHLARKALLDGECDLALCGGSQIMATPGTFVEFSRLRGLARDGRCKSFSDDAGGAGWAEGCAVLLLERLSDALRNKHPILALLRGSAINQDGRSQGLTAPSGRAQERVIRRALAESGLSPEDIDVLEAHGTGTHLGDPIEAGALSAVFGPGRPKGRPLYLGSVKSNIGHTQTASGVAGVIKMLLALQNQKLPRSLYSEKPNRRIEWQGSGLALLDQPREWARNGRVRRAGVNSFGISGTNAHVILEEAPLLEAWERPEGDLALPVVPLLVSAMDNAALRTQASRLAEHLDGHPGLSAVELAFSLATTRTHFPARLAMTVACDASPADIAAALRAFARGEPPPTLHHNVLGHRKGKRVALFAGQGSQRPGMGKDLYARFPVFREALNAICAELDPKLPRPLLEVMFAPPDSEAARLLDQTSYTQPALFALEVALHRQWERWGFVPDLLLGHSIGELAAAHVAGVLSLTDACTLVVARGRLMQSAPEGGAMFSVGATEQEVADLIAGMEDSLCIAALNEPGQTVISGDAAAAEAIAAELRAQGKRVHRLRVSHAFHSPHMNGILSEYRQLAEGLSYHEPRISLLSNLTGKLASAQQMGTAHYWARQVRGAVRFRDAVRSAEAAGADCYLEHGPRSVLSAMAASSTQSTESAFIPGLRDGSDEVRELVDALGRAHVAGVTLDWHQVFAGLPARKIDLPTYSFQRKSYWLPRPPRRGTSAESAGLHRVAHALLDAELPLPEGGSLFTAQLDPSSAPWLADHAIFEHVVLPGMSVMELLLTAGRRLGTPRLQSLLLRAPLIVPRGGTAAVQLHIDAEDAEGHRAFRVHARPIVSGAPGPFTLHASGVLEMETARSGPPPVAAWPPPGSTPVALDGLYERLAARGLHYGPAFRALREVHRAGTRLFGRLVLPADVPADGHGLHPALLDAGLHLLFAAESPGASEVMVPFELRDAWMGERAEPVREATVALEVGSGSMASLSFLDSGGALLASIGAIDFRSISPEKLMRGVERATSAAPKSRDALYRIEWTSLPSGEGPPARAGCALVGSGPLANELAALLRTSGVDVLRVEGTAALRDRLAGTRRRVTVVVRAVDAPDAADAADAAQRMTAELARELQQWTREPELAGYRHVLVTRNAISPEGSDLGALACSSLWGLCRSVRSENPERSWVLLDTDGDEASQRALPAALFAADEPEVALRRGERLAPRWLPALPSTQSARGLLNPEGTVLITGGTSGLGAEVAKHLATRHGVRHLLLASRRGSETPGASALLEQLAAAGCEATVAACDIADLDAVDALLRSIPDAHPLTAVFHSAAVLDGGLAMSLTADHIANVFAPKVRGAWNLHQLTQHRSLSAFVLFSSVAGIVGSEGQAAYAAANTFLDALAQQRRRAGLPACSLAFGPWAEVGMAARLPEVHQDRMRRAGFVSMPPAEALELMDRAMAQSEPMLLPVHLDEEALRQGGPKPWQRALFPGWAKEPSGAAEAVAQPQALPTPRQQLAAAPREEREAALLKLVRTEVAGVLKLSDPESIQLDQPLEQLGMDSLMAVDIRRRLENRLRVQLPPTLVFDARSPRLLVQHLASRWSGS